MNCRSKLQLQILVENHEIEEGILYCYRCGTEFPIICKIPILWHSFENYIKFRTRLGGELYQTARHHKLKKFIKNSLSHIRNPPHDLSQSEKRWVTIYQNSLKSKFYSIIKRKILPLQFDTSLEHGCSIGIFDFVAKNTKLSFGVDKSFYAILQAKKSTKPNIDYFVCDSLQHPFGYQKFDLVMGFNLLEIIEPCDLLKIILHQAKKFIILSDPYDFDRGKDSIKKPIDALMLRKILWEANFKLIQNTKKQSFIPWTLTLHPRAKLVYKTDVVVAQKIIK